MHKDPVRIAAPVGLYVVLYFLATVLLGPLFDWVVAYPAGVLVAGLVGALFANWLALRIFEDRHLVEVGLWLNRASADNLVLGLLGGAGAACVALAPPLLFHAAHFTATPAEQPSWMAVAWVLFFLLPIGVLGEELLFRGYAFQHLLASLGPWATILPVGILFGLLHAGNPNASRLGLANTAGFGILFGYAYLRSRDLWLPIGLHYGWNFTLPLFGANLSGLRMRVTGYELSWTAGRVWSGGDYGPEGGVLASAALVVLMVFLWKAPIRRQSSALTDPPAGSVVCEPPPRLLS
jgi:membrane protease YdiL (CAAX protease family)